MPGPQSNGQGTGDERQGRVEGMTAQGSNGSSESDSRPQGHERVASKCGVDRRRQEQEWSESDRGSPMGMVTSKGGRQATGQTAVEARRRRQGDREHHHVQYDYDSRAEGKPLESGSSLRTAVVRVRYQLC